ncbi:MAG: anaerobic ribonucleoside-triphosphate reductase activating protein [Clostridium sp.]|nr:anaerobic ribonucleoside-triphosphate reductase activating protein [Clostridium sp.]
MNIAGLQKSSLLDYPSKIAAVVFTLGCNFRCPYCHNPNLITAVSSEKLLDEAAVFDFLSLRKGKLDAVVVSGGEPTLQSDLENFFVKLKKLGFLTKLDTNGTNPETVQNLIDKHLVDYIAMDIKAPLEKYEEITGRKTDVEKIEKSINLIAESGVDYEFRTTVVRSQLSYEDFYQISKMLNGTMKYYLQKFKPMITLDCAFKKEETYTDEEFLEIKEIMQKNISNVFIR